MFHNTDQALALWLQSSCGIKSIKWSMPDTQHTSNPTIWCHLHGIEPETHGALERRLNVSFRVQYVITPTAKKVAQSHELLGKIAVAVQEEGAAEWITTPLQPCPWQGSPIAPLPSITMSLPATWEREADLASMVTEVHLATPEYRNLSGILLGPNKQAMANEDIHLPQFKQSCRSDADGTFHFHKIPLGKGRRLRIAVRNQQWELTPNTQPLTLRYQSPGE